MNRGLELIVGLDKGLGLANLFPGYGYVFLVPLYVELRLWRKSQCLRHSCFSGMQFIHDCIWYVFVDLGMLFFSTVCKNRVLPSWNCCFVVMWYFMVVSSSRLFLPLQ